MTVSVLITAIAVCLLVAAYRRNQILELGVLAIGAAGGLTVIDVVYTLRGVIPPVYLLDAAIEVPLIAAWVIVLLRKPVRALKWRPSGLREQSQGPRVRLAGNVFFGEDFHWSENADH